jgi:hypothetical protein
VTILIHSSGTNNEKGEVVYVPKLQAMKTLRESGGKVPRIIIFVRGMEASGQLDTTTT